MELVLFRARRCFVRLKESVVGVVVLREKDDNLFIGSLGVAKEYRRLGIATYILEYAERLASALRKEGLELTVLRTNTPAQRLYLKLGFTCKRETRFSLILQKSVKVK